MAAVTDAVELRLLLLLLEDWWVTWTPCMLGNGVTIDGGGGEVEQASNLYHLFSLTRRKQWLLCLNLILRTGNELECDGKRVWCEISEILFVGRFPNLLWWIH